MFGKVRHVYCYGLQLRNLRNIKARLPDIRASAHVATKWCGKPKECYG